MGRFDSYSKGFGVLEDEEEVKDKPLKKSFSEYTQEFEKSLLQPEGPAAEPPPLKTIEQKAQKVDTGELTPDQFMANVMESKKAEPLSPTITPDQFMQKVQGTEQPGAMDAYSVGQEQITSEVRPGEDIKSLSQEYVQSNKKAVATLNKFKNKKLDKLREPLKEDRKLRDSDKLLPTRKNKIGEVFRNTFAEGFYDEMLRMPEEDRFKAQTAMAKAGYFVGSTTESIGEFAALMMVMPEIPVLQKIPLVGTIVSHMAKNTGVFAAKMALDEIAQVDPDIKNFKARYKEASPYILALNLSTLFGLPYQMKPRDITIMKNLMGRGYKFTAGGAAAVAESLRQGKSFEDSLKIGAEAGIMSAITGPRRSIDITLTPKRKALGDWYSNKKIELEGRPAPAGLLEAPGAAGAGKQAIRLQGTPEPTGPVTGYQTQYPGDIPQPGHIQEQIGGVVPVPASRQLGIPQGDKVIRGTGTIPAGTEPIPQPAGEKQLLLNPKSKERIYGELIKQLLAKQAKALAEKDYETALKIDKKFRKIQVELKELYEPEPPAEIAEQPKEAPSPKKSEVVSEVVPQDVPIETKAAIKYGENLTDEQVSQLTKEKDTMQVEVDKAIDSRDLKQLEQVQPLITKIQAINEAIGSKEKAPQIEKVKKAAEMEEKENNKSIVKEINESKQYHGSSEIRDDLEITDTNATNPGNAGTGVHVTPWKAIARGYGPKVDERAVKIENPLIIERKGSIQDYRDNIDKAGKELGVTATSEWSGTKQLSRKYADEFREKALAAGYDSSVTIGDKGIIEAVLYSPETQIAVKEKAAEAKKPSMEERIAKAVDEDKPAPTKDKSLIEEYKGVSIRKDNTVRQDKFYGVLPENRGVEYGSTVEILKRKIDKATERVTEAKETTKPKVITGYDHKIVKDIRLEIESGKPEKGNLVRNNEGDVVGRFGASSSYPEYFQGKGFTKKYTLGLIDKYLEGKPLTVKQAKVLDGLYSSSGYEGIYKDALAQLTTDLNQLGENGIAMMEEMTDAEIDQDLLDNNLEGIITKEDYKNVVKEVKKGLAKPSNIMEGKAEKGTEEVTLKPKTDEIMKAEMDKKTQKQKEEAEKTKIEKKYEIGKSIEAMEKLFDDTPEGKTISMSGMYNTEGGKIGAFEKIEGADGEAEDLKIANEVIDMIKSFVGGPLTEGKLPKSVLGQYQDKTKTIKLRGLTQLSTAIHEITHAIDYKHKISNKVRIVTGYASDGKPMYDKEAKKERKELSQIYVQYYGGASPLHDLRKRTVEGLAVLLQKYIEMPQTISKTYPFLVKEFLKPGGKYYTEETGQLIKKSQEIVGRYQSLPALDKIGAMVTGEQLSYRKNSFMNFGDVLRTEIADKIWPIEKLSLGAGIQMTDKDPSVWLHQYNNFYSLALNNILSPNGYYGYSKGSFIKKYDENWSTLVKTLNDKKISDTFGYYLVSRRGHYDYLELDDRKKAVDLIAKEIREAIESGDTMEDLMAAKNENGMSIIDEYNEAKREWLNFKQILDNDPFVRKDLDEAWGQNRERFSVEEKLFDKLTREDLDFAANDDVQLVTPKQYDEWTSRKGYASYQREMFDSIVETAEQTELMTGGGMIGRNIGGTKISTTKGRKGSSRAILNPVYSAIRVHAETTRKSLKQVIYNKMLNLVEDHPDIFAIDKLSRTVDPSGAVFYPQERDPNYIMARRNYVRVPIRADQFVKRVLEEALTINNLGVFAKLLKGSSRLFTKGTTGLYYPFAISNFVIDQITAAANTEKSFTPVYSALKALTSVIADKLMHQPSEDSAYFMEFLQLGGDRYTMMKWMDKGPDELFQAINKERTGIFKVIDWISSGQDVLGIPAKYSEVSSRAVEYIASRKSGESQIVSLERAGRITAPFHHVGRWGGPMGETWIKSIPFYNPALQVLDQMSRRLGTEKGRKRYAFVVVALTSAMIAGFQAIQSSGTDEQKDLYDDLGTEELARYLWLPNTDGKSLVKIRVPENLTMFGNIFNMGYSGKYTPKEYLDVSAAWIPDQFKVWELPRAVLAWIPHLIGYPTKGILNVKTWPRISEIEGPTVKYKTKTEREFPNTSKVASFISKKINALGVPDEYNLSPIMIDYYLENTFGRSIKFATIKPNTWKINVFKKEDYFYSGRSLERYYDVLKTTRHLKQKEFLTKNEEGKVKRNERNLKKIKSLFKKMRALETDDNRVIGYRKDIREYISELEL